MGQQLVEFDDLERTLVRGLQENGWGRAGLQGFEPAPRAQAPAIPGFQTGKVEAGRGGRQVVALCAGELQEGVVDLGTDGVQTRIVSPGPAAAIPQVTGPGFQAADAQLTAQDIARMIGHLRPWR